MFITPVKKFLGLGTVLGIGGLGLFGGNELSKKTIKDVLGNKKMVEEEIMNENTFGAWHVLSWKIKGANDPESSEKLKIKSYDFKSLGINNDDIESLKKLKEKCRKSLDSKYSDLFTENKDLMDDVRNFCFLSIKDMLLGVNSIFDVLEDSYSQEDKNFLQDNLLKIKNSSETLEINDPRLLEMKNKFSLGESNPGYEESFKLLFEFCKEGYSTPYIGNDESISLKNLINNYCVKERNQIINHVSP